MRGVGEAAVVGEARGSMVTPAMRASEGELQAAASQKARGARSAT
jgi:hypothetical protein